MQPEAKVVEVQEAILPLQAVQQILVVVVELPMEVAPVLQVVPV
jgi:hypothetical protein